MVTLSVVRQWLGKHVSATMDSHAAIKRMIGNGVFYAVLADGIG
jgi:hypothetical protein